ncbi:hypothetical protein PF050_08360 [Kosakonia pseudosacchari]|uniref:hypothetical protein n=1 Tax=Kosakonia pseudosacchari TaxID=1646340 RepID=UPI0022EFFCD6|nr:hypothetical protein [Kosakonia pseudosacchari]WBU50910.1 hypothetical protein PF050_08360 [Kosakonia pseudosacchari]
MKNETTEIDLLELLFFIKKKSKSIIFSMAVALILAIVFLWVEKDEVNINYEVKINSDAPSMIINCDTDTDTAFDCKSNFIEAIIKGNSDRFTIQSDERTKVIKLTWRGKASEKPIADAAIKTIYQKINAWYVQDYQAYKRIIDDNKNNGMNGTELYTKIAFITKLDYSKKNDFIFISKGEVSEKYIKGIFIVLALMMGFILSTSYHLMKRSIVEYSEKKIFKKTQIN